MTYTTESMRMPERLGKEVHRVFYTAPDGTVTPIAEAADAEKAHFLVTAANAYREPFSGAVDDAENATLGELVAGIRTWAADRNLIAGSTAAAQTVKLFEEGGELAGGVARGKRDVIEDSIGDMVVVLVIIAAISGMDFRECVAAAYAEIKDRKGRMADGVFVREE